MQTRLDEDEASKPPINVIPINVDPVSTSASDDYFQTVVVNSLLVILSDHSLSNHHHTVIEAIMSIFKTQGLKCIAFLPRVRIGAAFDVSYAHKLFRSFLLSRQ